MHPLLRYCLFVFFIAAAGMSAQQKFDPAHLNDASYGAEIAAELNTIEVEEYRDTLKQRIYLKNGFRSSQFLNEKDWLSIKDTVVPYRIDIVYSKYPLRNGVYLEIYPLLLSRLKAIFLMDPELNNTAIQWNKIWQTHCENDAQVNKLFHGVVIWYKLKAQITATVIQTPTVHLNTDPDQEKLVNEQQSYDDLMETMDYIKASPFFPDSMKKKLHGKKLEVQIRLIREYFEKQVAKGELSKLTESSPELQRQYQEQVNNMLLNYPVADNVVMQVLSRHPEWKNMLIVNDWTGSMYGYGAQVLQWHLQNFDKSGLVALTLFNDGDFKRSHEKKVGNTGGIYTGKADDFENLFSLFHMVMLRGSGGDSPENDVEAIMKAMEAFPDHTDVVLIADNYACVRDIELADRIKKPVKVIICGYDKDRGVNPDYVYLAKKTGGGVYTIEDDLENIQAEAGYKGELSTFNDERFKVWGKKCGDAGRFSEGELYTSYKKALRNKKEVRKLSLEKQGLKKIPKGVFKMKKLNYLNISNNSIVLLPPQIAELTYLKTLDAGYNGLSLLPEELKTIHYVENLNLAGNSFTAMPPTVAQMRYLRVLDFSNNGLRQVEEKLYFRKCEQLNLANNQLASLPNSISQLKYLKYLNLSGNKLKTLPEDMGSLTRLEELNLEDNQLSSLPEKLYKMRKLKVLRLAGNDISFREKQRILKELPNTTVHFGQ